MRLGSRKRCLGRTTKPSAHAAPGAGAAKEAWLSRFAGQTGACGSRLEGGEGSDLLGLIRHVKACRFPDRARLGSGLYRHRSRQRQCRVDRTAGAATASARSGRDHRSRRRTGGEDRPRAAHRGRRGADRQNVGGDLPRGSPRHPHARRRLAERSAGILTIAPSLPSPPPRTARCKPCSASTWRQTAGRSAPRKWRSASWLRSN